MAFIDIYINVIISPCR